MGLWKNCVSVRKEKRKKFSKKSKPKKVTFIESHH